MIVTCFNKSWLFPWFAEWLCLISVLLLCTFYVCQWASLHFGSSRSLVFLVQMCPLFSCCVCVHSHRPIERGWLYCHSLATGKPTWCDITKHYGVRPWLCFRSPEQLTARQGQNCPGLLLFCCRPQMCGGEVKGRSGWKRVQGRGWEMTDGRMESCQAIQNDSWNRLSIYDCPRKTSLSGGCHINMVIKQSSWQVVLESHTSYESRWSKEFDPMRDWNGSDTETTVDSCKSHRI